MDSGNNRFNYNTPSLLQGIQEHKNVNIGQVVSVDDPNGLGRIKVSINGTALNGGDSGIPVADLAWCTPMLPKFFSVQPKVGESVFIFTFSNDKKHSDRLYLGPIISQLQNLNYDPRNSSSLVGFTFGVLEPDVTIDNVPEINGVFPNNEDISIQGRYNTDIILKTNEIRIRAGKFVESKPNKNNPFTFTFNDTNPAYIQVKNNAILKQTSDTQELGSVVNLVANKINLLTHKDGNPRFDLTDQIDLISSDDLLNILQNAHPIPFGDILLQYLILIKNALFTHVHNGNGNVATDLTSGNTQFIAQFKKQAEALENQLNSKNILIN